MDKYLFAVTRQHYYYSGEKVVEIAQGGIDYCNADALIKKYDGEFQEFRSLKKAVEVAIDICRKWRKDGAKDARVALGCTHGYGLEFEATTFKDAIKKAEEFEELVPKCDYCGDPIYEEWFSDEGDQSFCSRYCAEKSWEEVMKAWIDQSVEEEAEDDRL